MLGHALGQQIVRAGCKIDLASGGVLLPQNLEQRLIVGQMSDIERGHRRDVALERCLALDDPPGKLQQRAGTLPRQH